jgi:copper resistance protein B
VSRIRLLARTWLFVATMWLPAAAFAQATADRSAGSDRQETHVHPQPAPLHHEPATPPADLPSFIPRLTDEDRQAAFPDVGGHAAHDAAWHSFVLVDRLEWQVGGGRDGLNLDARGWIGGDRDRLRFRVEGVGESGRVGDAQAHALYGRQISRWWDVVAGLRQDVRPGPAQTWAAVGIQGLAPYWFQVEATGYVGAGGRTQVRFEVEYELLMTNRLVLQPLVELELNGKTDPERGVEAGLSRTEAGFRLRYELRREFAPYVGVVWKSIKGEGEKDGPRLVTGLRVWF